MTSGIETKDAKASGSSTRRTQEEGNAPLQTLKLKDLNQLQLEKDRQKVSEIQ